MRCAHSTRAATSSPSPRRSYGNCRSWARIWIPTAARPLHSSRRTPVSLDGESYINTYLTETSIIASQIDHLAISGLVDLLVRTRDVMGRVFVLGLGGS